MVNLDGLIGVLNYKIGGSMFNNVGDVLMNFDGCVGSNMMMFVNYEMCIGNVEINIVGNMVVIVGL